MALKGPLMRKLFLIRIAAATVASAGTIKTAFGRTRTLTTLISIRKSIPHGLDWYVLGTHY